MLQKVYTFLKTEILLAGHLLSFGGGILASLLIIVLLPGSRYNPLIALTIYLFVQPIYWIDRYMGVKKDKNDNPERTKHISNYYNVIPYISFIYISLFSFISLTYLDKRSFIIGISMFILGYFYTVIFKRLTKYIIGFKNYFVASFYTVFLVYAFLYSNVGIYNLSAVLIYIFVFIRSINVQIFLDLKDINSDKAEELKTIPVVIGKSNSIKIMNIINILSITPIIYGVLLGALPLYILLILIVIFPYSQSIKRFTKKPNKYQFITVGSEYLFLSLLIIAGIITTLI